MKLSKKFVDGVIAELQKVGVIKYNIVCIMHYGSSLYVKHYDDYDFKVIVKHHTPHTKNTVEGKVLNTKIHYVFYTMSEWNNILNERDQCVVAECNEMTCIYGDDSEFYRYDVVIDKEVQKYLVTTYDEHLFNCEDQEFYLGDKRLWNFLLFAFKVKNQSDKLKWRQRHLINKAHDLKLNKEKFRPLFNELKEKLL